MNKHKKWKKIRLTKAPGSGIKRSIRWWIIDRVIVV